MDYDPPGHSSPECSPAPAQTRGSLCRQSTRNRAFRISGRWIDSSRKPRSSHVDLNKSVFDGATLLSDAAMSAKSTTRRARAGARVRGANRAWESPARLKRATSEDFENFEDFLSFRDRSA